MYACSWRKPGALSLAEVQVSGEEAALLAEKQNLVDWIRGKDVKDENKDGSTTDCLSSINC